MKVGLIAPSLSVPDAFANKSEHLFGLSGNNTGNFAFVHAIFQHLLPNVEIFPWHTRAEIVRERCEIIVVACANQLGAHSDLGGWASALEQFDLPVVGIGLGAQAKERDGFVNLTGGTRRWLDVMAAMAPSSAPNLGLRGDFTLRQLEHFGLGNRGAVMGCPSNLINGRSELYAELSSKVSKNKIERLAVAGGTRHVPMVAEIEQNLVRLMIVTNGSYIVQADLDMIRIARGEFDSIDAGELDKIRAYILPKSTIDEFKLWCKQHALCFIDAASWMEAIRNYDFAAGARFHGVMLAIQAGTPGGVVAHDSRTAEMCDTMLIPFKTYSELGTEIRIEDLISLFPFDANQYRIRRGALAREYISILSSAGIKAGSDLVKIGAAPAVAASPTATPSTSATVNEKISSSAASAIAPNASGSTY